jgi:two-component system, NtrC family, sensor kinase
VIDRQTIHIHDFTTSMDEFPEAVGREHGFRTTLTVPLLREGTSIGVIIIRRVEVRPFSDTQITLLQTFADQAVIAIENVRLFKELEARNHDLTRALDQQTATSDILRAISASPIDVQPVFEAIARNSVRLCNGVLGAVFRFDGEFMHVGLSTVTWRMARRPPDGPFPRAPERRMLAGRAVLSRAIVHVPDVLADSEFDYRALAATADWRSLLVVPMLRGGEVLGTVGVSRARTAPRHLPRGAVPAPPFRGVGLKHGHLLLTGMQVTSNDGHESDLLSVSWATVPQPEPTNSGRPFS